jgi:poly-gamma-glutamate capsule biosynthesis protein CapA/YwtB (metallophosphatase superfamily)/SHS2 domain-containing protein
VTKDAITLFLCGDVMTGRGVDQILPHPSSPELFEDYVHSSAEYVDLAEKANGPIPRGAGFQYIWGDALAELDRFAPSARIVNLETAVTTSAEYTPRGINYRMNPANVPCLTAAKIDCCVLANNHVRDWGSAGLEETMRSIRSAGIGTAGAGFSLSEALRPCAIDTGSERILVFAFAAADSGVPPWWSASADHPGIAFLPDLSDATANRISGQIAAARHPGGIVVISLHWGGNWGYEVPRSQRAFAHRLIEGGADVIYGHSAHHRKAIEIYRDRPVFYGCGDFINDYEGIEGHEEYRSHLVLAYFVSLDRSTHRLVSLEMTPFETYRFSLRKAGQDDARWLSETLSRESAPFGTRVTLRPGNRMSLGWETKQPRWEHFAHGADIGVRGVGDSKEEAFRQAALALTAVITDPGRVVPEQSVTIEREAPDDEILLLDWLNALIYEMSVNQLLFGAFDVEIHGHQLRATARGEQVDVTRHEPAVEVKGATCTGLSVAQKADGEWIAQCVVDV